MPKIDLAGFTPIHSLEQPQKRNPIAAGLSSGVDDFQGTAYSAGAAVADLVGADRAKEWLQEQADRNEQESAANGRPDLERIEDQSWSTALPYVAYQVSKQVPNLAASIAGGMLVPEAAIPAALSRTAAALPKVIGGGGLRIGMDAAAEAAAKQAGKEFVRTAIGALPIGTIQGTGSMYKESVDAGNPQAGKALALSPLYGLTEAVTPAMMKNTFMRGIGEGTGGLIKRMAKSSLIEGVGEAATEGLQTEMELAFNPNQDPEQKFSKRLNSIVAGGLVGGVMGSTGGIRSHKEKALLGGTNSGSTVIGEAPANEIQSAIDTDTAIGSNDAGQLALPQQPINPYDLGGHVTALQRGAVFNPDSQQQEMWGAQDAPSMMISPSAMATAQATVDPKQLAAQQKAAEKAQIEQQKQEQEAKLQQAMEVVTQKYGEEAPHAEAGFGYNWNGEHHGTEEELRKAKEKAVRREAGMSPGQRAFESMLADEVRGTDLGTTKELNKLSQGTVGAQSLEQAVKAPRLLTQVQQMQNQLASEEAKNADGSNMGDPEKIAKLTKSLDALRAVFEKAGVKFPEAPAAVAKNKVAETKPAKTDAATSQTQPATTGQPTIIVPKGKKRVAVTKESMQAMLRTAPQQKKEVVYGLLGMDAEGHQVGNPQSMAEVATARGISPQRVQQIAAEFGINEDVVNRATAYTPEAVGLSELVPSQQEDGGDHESSGFQITDSVGQSKADEHLTADQKRKATEATELLKTEGEESTVITPEEQARAEAIEAKRQAEAEAARRKALIQAIQSPYAKVAGEDWDDMRSKGAPAFDTLSVADKVEWITVYEAYKNGKIEDAELVDHQRGMEPHVEVVNEGNNAEPTQLVLEGGISDAAGEATNGEGRSEVSQERGAGSSDVSQGGSAEEFKDYNVGAGNTAAVQVKTKKKRTAVKPDTAQQSKGTATQGSNAENIRKELTKFIGSEINARRVVVVQSMDELPTKLQQSVGANNDTQGFVINGKAYLIADNIDPGNARAVFMHEVGSHLGLERLLGDEHYDKLVDKILEWSERKNDSLESVLAVAALRRVASANPDESQRNTELVAYFIEEAVNHGVDPTAMQYKTELQRWFRTMWAAFKQAIRKLGLVNADKLTAQDVVDLAYGAARLEATGAFHGTAANFRKFDHKYMGSGEGAQAYGWGSYFAQRAGIAEGYRQDDEARKSEYTYRVGDEVIPSPWDAKGKIRNKGYLTPAQLAVLEIETGFGNGDPQAAYEALSSGQHTATVASKPKFQQMMAILKDIVDGKLQYEANVNPAKGVTHRADFNIADDEWLQWDKPISEQSEKVKAALEKVREELEGNDLLEEYLDHNGKDWEELTGAEFYKQIMDRAHMDDSSIFFDVPGTDAMPSDKATSLVLDSLGIKGIKFHDSNSRGNLYSLKYIPAHNVWTVVDNVTGKSKFFSEDKAAAQAWMEKREPAKTSNLVVFNDKNIQRVATHVGGLESDKVQFSKRAQTAIAKLPDELQGPVQRITDNLQHAAQKGLNYLAFTQDLADMMAKKVGAVKDYMDAMKVRSTTHEHRMVAIEQFKERYEALPKHEQGEDGLLSKYLYDATTSGKWGFAPSWRTDATVDAAMKARHKAMSPAAQKLAEDIFKHGHDTLQEKQDLLNSEINADYDERIRMAKEAKVDAKEIAQLEKDRASTLKTFGTQLSELSGPYAPVKRYGDFVVVTTSPEYNTEVEAKNWSKVYEMRKDAKHYQVHFVDTPGEANALKRTLEAKFPGMTSRASEKITALEALHGGDERFTVFRKLKKLAADEFGEDSKAARSLNHMIGDLYLTTLAEANARKSNLRRENIEGGSRDMMRNFYTQGRADATFIAGLQQNGKVTDAITTMIQQAKASDDPMKFTGMVNEMLKRHVLGMQHQNTPIQDRVASFNSAWMLLTSPATILTNGTQTAMVTVPQLAAKFGYAQAAGQVKRAYYEVGAMLKGTGVFKRVNLDAAPKDVKNMLQTLLDRGRIDITLDQELGRVIKNGESTVLDKTMAKLRAATQKVETINRVTAATAAYRLALKANMSEQEAIDYADKMVYLTHGDYSGFNASRAFKLPGAKVLLQFKKYQMFQIGLLARNFHEAFTGASAEEKMVARKALMFSMAHYAAMGGLLGLPGMNILGPMLGALLGDPDEPNDEEVTLRRIIGDKDMADLLLYGAPGAVGLKSLSERLGGRNLTSIMPFTDLDLSTRTGYEKALTALSGPFLGGLLPRTIMGVNDLWDGKYYDGIAKVAPTGVGNLVKAVAQMDRGLVNSRGDTLIQPDDISFMSALGQAIGLPTDTIKDAQFAAKFEREYEKFYSGKQHDLSDAYARAAKAGDTEEMADLREQYTALQDSMRRNGFKPSPLSNLLKAPAEQAKRERNVIRGVETTTKNRGFLRAMEDQ